MEAHSTPLREALIAHFGDESFTIEEAGEFYRG